MQASKILLSISRFSVYALIFLAPIFFLPFTPEIIEFSKQYLMYALVSVGFLAWIARGFVERKITFLRTLADLPLLALWVGILLSSIFSKDPTMSFFGSPERLTFGFVPATFYLLFFYLVLNHISAEAQIKRFLAFMILGAVAAALYFWLYTAGILSARASLPVWNTVAVTNARFGAALLVPLIAALVRLLSSKKSSLILSVGEGLAAALLFATAVSLGFRNVFVLGAIALGLLLAFSLINLKEVRVAVISATLLGFLAFIILAIFGSAQFLRVADLPGEVSITGGASRTIALQTMKEGLGRAFLGSGPATFIYDFSAHRPQNFNNNALWSLRFSTPFSEASGLLATLGVLSGVALFFAVAVSVLCFRAIRGRGAKYAAVDIYGRGAGAAWFTLLVMLFFMPFGTVAWLYLAGALALLLSATRFAQGGRVRAAEIAFDRSPQTALAASFGSLTAATAILVLGVFLGRFYAGEVRLNEALKAASAQDIDAALIKAQQARSLNPDRVRFSLALAQLQFQKAVRESQKAQPDSAELARVVSEAVRSARRATELAPNLTAAWELLGGIYVNVIPVVPEALQWAIDAYSRAIALEPTNPALHAARGNLYLSDKKPAEARGDFERAVELKADYGPAYESLARFFEGQNDLEAAIAAQENAVRYGQGSAVSAFTLARLYINRNESDDAQKAEQILRALVARNPDYANALFALGDLYEKQGKVDEALAQFRKVQELNPENEEVRKKIQTLSGQLTPLVPTPAEEE